MKPSTLTPTNTDAFTNSPSLRRQEGVGLVDLRLALDPSRLEDWHEHRREVFKCLRRGPDVDDAKSTPRLTCDVRQDPGYRPVGHGLHPAPLSAGQLAAHLFVLLARKRGRLKDRDDGH